MVVQGLAGVKLLIQVIWAGDFECACFLLGTSITSGGGSKLWLLPAGLNHVVMRVWRVRMPMGGAENRFVTLVETLEGPGFL